MFVSLKVRNFGLFLGGQIVSNVGTWMQRIAQDWLVYQLSGHDAVALGVAVALQFTPTLVLSLWAGLLADRLPKRRLCSVIQCGIAVQALALGLLDVAGVVALWQIYVLCVVLGCLSAVDVPARQAFVAELVPPPLIANAVALNATVFNLARAAGPALAGFAITMFGTGWMFIVNAGTTVVAIVSLLAVDARKLVCPVRVPRGRGQLRAGLAYVRERPQLVRVMVIAFLVSTFSLTFSTSLTVMAGAVFRMGAGGYGILSTVLAVGTLLGALGTARWLPRTEPAQTRVLLLAALAVGAVEVGAALLPTPAVFGAALVPLGVATITFLNTANSIVQTTVEPGMRGRVMSLYVLVLIGGSPVGGPLAGWLADAWGGRAPLVAGGLVAALAAVGCRWLLHRRNTREFRYLA
ncbi:MFS transporter [Amycolatopsis sp. RM579]|uniref:MFS transporter n=2 Tax=Amycolatopsis pithecellobii TaxID=664692 RepID=A0A6N7YIJ5_9PSEU|nr:MFS transporter [Amycolatopsis pithecellobii]